MKKYKIDILPDAVQDIADIRADIIEKYHDAYNADVVINNVFDKINSLVIYPKLAQVRLEVFKLKLRFLKSGKYMIVYSVDSNENAVRIYGVFHSHRNIFKIVKDRI